MAKEPPFGYGFIIKVVLTIFIIAFAYQALIIAGVDLPTPFIRIPGEDDKNLEVSDIRKITKVLDGDTLRVEANGIEDKVRLIGINTPELATEFTSEECYGKESYRHLKSLGEGEMVTLVYDETQDRRDAYNRLLAYVFLDDGQMLNRKMIAEGYAYEYTYLLPYKYQKEFRELANFAKNEGRGLWSSETCGGLK